MSLWPLGCLHLAGGVHCVLDRAVRVVLTLVRNTAREMWNPDLKDVEMQSHLWFSLWHWPYGFTHLNLSFLISKTGCTKLFIELLKIQNTAISLLYIHSGEMKRKPVKCLYINMHGGITHNNKKWERKTKISIDCWMNKQKVVYPYNGVLFLHKKNKSLIKCCNMHGP